MATLNFILGKLLIGTGLLLSMSGYTLHQHKHKPFLSIQTTFIKEKTFSPVVEAIGKSSDQDLAAIKSLFNVADLTNIGSAFTGLAALQLSAGNANVLVFGLSVLIVCLVLSAQYESHVMPVIILGTLPLAMLGALAFLAMRSIDLNIYAQVGLVTLIGLAAKNGILIVEVAEQKLEQGLSITEAAVQSAEKRLRPILVTAIAAIAGFLPQVVANGAGAHSQQSWAPLSVEAC